MLQWSRTRSSTLQHQRPSSIFLLRNSQSSTLLLLGNPSKSSKYQHYSSLPEIFKYSWWSSKSPKSSFNSIKKIYPENSQSQTIKEDSSIVSLKKNPRYKSYGHVVPSETEAVRLKFLYYYDCQRYDDASQLVLPHYCDFVLKDNWELHNIPFKKVIMAILASSPKSGVQQAADLVKSLLRSSAINESEITRLFHNLSITYVTPKILDLLLIELSPSISSETLQDSVFVVLTNLRIKHLAKGYHMIFNRHKHHLSLYQLELLGIFCEIIEAPFNRDLLISSEAPFFTDGIFIKLHKLLTEIHTDLNIEPRQKLELRQDYLLTVFRAFVFRRHFKSMLKVRKILFLEPLSHAQKVKFEEYTIEYLVKTHQSKSLLRYLEKMAKLKGHNSIKGRYVGWLLKCASIDFPWMITVISRRFRKLCSEKALLYFKSKKSRAHSKFYSSIITEYRYNRLVAPSAIFKAYQMAIINYEYDRADYMLDILQDNYDLNDAISFQEFKSELFELARTKTVGAQKLNAATIGNALNKIPKDQTIQAPGDLALKQFRSKLMTYIEVKKEVLPFQRQLQFCALYRYANLSAEEFQNLKSIEAVVYDHIIFAQSKNTQGIHIYFNQDAIIDTYLSLLYHCQRNKKYESFLFYLKRYAENEHFHVTSEVISELHHMASLMFEHFREDMKKISSGKFYIPAQFIHSVPEFINNYSVYIGLKYIKGPTRREIEPKIVAFQQFLNDVFHYRQMLKEKQQLALNERDRFFVDIATFVTDWLDER